MQPTRTIEESASGTREESTRELVQYIEQQAAE